MKLEVGQPYLPIAGRGEGVIFDIDDVGARLIYNFNRPRPNEVDAVKAGQPFEIRYVEIGGLLWITSKCGNLSWTDAPYNPRLSLAPEWPTLEPGKGLALMLMMTDSETAIIQYLRLIALGEQFSAALLKDAARLQDMPMTVPEYQAALRSAMSRYKTSDLTRMAKIFFKIRG